MLKKFLLYVNKIIILLNLSIIFITLAFNVFTTNQLNGIMIWICAFCGFGSIPIIVILFILRKIINTIQRKQCSDNLKKILIIISVLISLIIVIPKILATFNCENEKTVLKSLDL